MSYKVLSDRIRNVDIGTVNDINPLLTEGLCDNELGEGMFRNLVEFALRLAEFYIKVDEKRKDKLKYFATVDRKNEPSLMFLLAVGGDEAPVTGTSFLLSFLNVGRRICSSFENYLLFGANVKENGIVVRRFILKFMSELKHLESAVFTVNVGGKQHLVEFKLKALPNDMKMLAFLAGELSNAAYYFSTFANVHKANSNDVTLSFSLNEKTEWKPFEYVKRVNDAKLVQEKKIALSKKKIKYICDHVQ